MRRIFFLFLFLLLTVLTVNSFCFSIPSTTTGTISMVVKSLGAGDEYGPSQSDNYFTIGGSVFSYGYRPMPYGGYNQVVIEDSNSVQSAFYFTTDPDDIQDMLTFVFDGADIHVFVNGDEIPKVYGSLSSPVLSGEVVLSNSVVANTFNYTPEILSSSQVSDRLNTYKRFGNYGNTIIDKFFNQVFSLMSGQ